MEPTGNKRTDEDGKNDRERLIARWHRAAHSIAIFPGILIAYLLGAMSGGRFSLLTVILIMLALEAISLLLAFIFGKLRGK